MSIERFEAGKKYKNLNTGAIFYCIGFTENNNVVFEHAGVLCTRGIGPISDYEEYKELVKGIVWVNIYKSIDMYLTGVYYSRQVADHNSKFCTYPRIACIEVPWEEGRGL